MKRILLTLGLLVSSVSAPLLARAALGDRMESVEADRAQLKATRKAAVVRQASAGASASYTVQELDLDGTVVREFVTNDGVVFAIAWRGLSRPDLSQLLGSYYGTYKAARAALPRAQRQSVVQSNNLVVRHGGHMRDLRGQAVLSNLVPDGVSVGDLQ